VLCGTVWLKPESIIISSSIHLWCQQHYLLSCWCYGYCTAAFITELQPINSRSWHCTADHDIQTGYLPNTCSSLHHQQFCLCTYLRRWGCALSDVISLWTAPVSASKASMNQLHIIVLLVIFSVSSNHPILILKELKLRSLYRIQCKPVSLWFRARLDIWQNEQDLRSWLL
jgi:hypothetical protein